MTGGHLNVFVGEMSSQVFGPLFKMAICCLAIVNLSSLYILDICPLFDIWFANICPNLWVYLFILFADDMTVCIENPDKASKIC
jgi:hypothetical protein